MYFSFILSRYLFGDDYVMFANVEVEVIDWMRHPQVGSNEEKCYCILHLFIIFCGRPLKTFVSVCFLGPSLSASAPQLTRAIHLFVIYSSVTLSPLLSFPLSLLIISCNL